MIQGHSVLAIVPARGGSKGVRKKNIKKLAGKPLIAWTISEAQKSKYIDRLILSSDDDAIIKVAKKLNCEVPFLRPCEIAKDDTPGIEVVLHAIKALPERYDYIVLLQPTSPLRLVDDIDGCIGACIDKNAPACVSVSKVTQHPSWMYRINNSGTMVPFMKRNNEILCRQYLPEIYILNGALYVSNVNWLTKKKSFLSPLTKAYIMPTERSLDIDDQIDFEIAEYFLRNKKNRNR